MTEEIRAEMVANVWKVVVKVGDKVAEGDTLVILESMKMEIPVITESDGFVQQLAVKEADVIQEGDLIAVIGDEKPKAAPAAKTTSVPQAAQASTTAHPATESRA